MEKVASCADIDIDIDIDIVSSIQTLDLLSLRVTNRTSLKVFFIATCYFQTNDDRNPEKQTATPPS